MRSNRRRELVIVSECLSKAWRGNDSRVSFSPRFQNLQNVALIDADFRGIDFRDSSKKPSEDSHMDGAIFGGHCHVDASKLPQAKLPQGVQVACEERSQ
jgi:phosphoribosyl 1,2-cyclic phosphodiesterase